MTTERSLHPTLIVGTGRCGSTLLSSMMRRHPLVASISEVFSFVTDLGTRIERAFPPGDISGPEFWRIFCEPQPRQNLLLQHGLCMPEVIYPFHRGGFNEANIPPGALTMAPHLDEHDPDGLYAYLERTTLNAPSGPVSRHYQLLFDSIAAHFGKQTWVERSGGSLRVLARLLPLFPEARWIHIVRDGRDTALSMSRHIGFRMALLCGTMTEMLGSDPFETDDRTDEQDLTGELAALLPENFSRGAFEVYDLPPEICGHYWSGEIRCGLDALSSLPANRLLTLRYEDLLEDPVRSTRLLGEFVHSEVDPNWLATAASMVEPQAPRWTGLSESEIQELTAACEPGFAALADHGLHWG